MYLSGAGADEVYGDYGRIRAWPANLSEVWPWPSFFHQEMRDYLRKEEYVAGAWGIEGRYPFLDADLVQVGCCRRPLPSPLATTASACQATAFTAVVAPPPPQPSHPILPPLQEFLSLNTTLKAQATKYPLLSYMRDAGCAPPPPGHRRHLAEPLPKYTPLRVSEPRRCHPRSADPIANDKKRGFWKLDWERWAKHWRQARVRNATRSTLRIV